jgi:hypothetical protein
MATQDETSATLAELQRELSELVLRHAAETLARDPGLPLSSALLNAVEGRVRGALADGAARADEAEIAERVLQALRPELAAIGAGRADDGWDSDAPAKAPPGLAAAFSASGGAAKGLVAAAALLLFLAGAGVGAFLGFERGAALRVERPMTPPAAAPTLAPAAPATVAAPADQPGG